MLRKLIGVLLSLMVIGLGLAGCSGSTNTNEKSAATPEATVAPASEDLLTSGIAIIKMYNLSFVPDEITIPVGTTVRWTNEDTLQHTATADDGSFDSKELSYGESYSVKFDKPGTYTYKCADHITMIGKIIVKAK